jgi:hypothetical protein
MVAYKRLYMNVDSTVNLFIYYAEKFSRAVLLLAVTANTEILILEKYLEEAHTLISAQTAPLVSKRKRRWNTEKKKIFSSYIGKFRVERLQSHI